MLCGSFKVSVGANVITRKTNCTHSEDTVVITVSQLLQGDRQTERETEREGHTGGDRQGEGQTERKGQRNK